MADALNTSLQRFLSTTVRYLKIPSNFIKTNVTYRSQPTAHAELSQMYFIYFSAFVFYLRAITSQLHVNY